jgi:hypothetical protein
VRIPRRTNRLHVKPYWLGDSPAAINKAARQRIGSDGGRYIDINLTRCKDGVLGVHWSTPAQNGYHWITTGKGRRALTRAEEHRPFSQWTLRDAKRLRRTRRRGLRYESRVRIYSYPELLNKCKNRRVIPTFELKSRTFDDRTVAKQMVDQAKMIGWTPIFMTLVNMKRWRGKMKAFHLEGAPTALLAHSQPRPHDLDKWMPYIDVIWGRWR